MASDSEKLAKIDAKYTDLARVLRLEDVPTIDIATLQKWLEDEAENVVLVDVRSREEAEVSTLPGALWVEEFERDAAKYEGRKVVSFCTIGARSGSYAKRLRESGVEAYNLAGSVLGWTHRGLPLVCRPIDPGEGRPQAPPAAAGAAVRPGGEQPTRRVHVYGQDWALAADGYEQARGPPPSSWGGCRLRSCEERHACCCAAEAG